MHSQFRDAFAHYTPRDGREAIEQRAILEYIDLLGPRVLTRESLIAHITSSSLIVNPAVTRTLMIHHNIRDAWAWTGGHADGDGDLLRVALREAMEETGAPRIVPLTEQVASVDVLYVHAHTKRGQAVGVHLHLNVTYILLCPDDAPLAIKPDENSGVRWFAFDEIAQPLFSADDVRLYGKLIRFAQQHTLR